MALSRWMTVGTVLLVACSATSAGNGPAAEGPKGAKALPLDWNELSRWLPEPRWGQWAEISAALKTWRPKRLTELEPELETWDNDRRYPWLRVLDPETTERWLTEAPLTPQELWLARWSDRLHLSEEQLAKHHSKLTSAQWWARSPIVVGPSPNPAGWSVMLPNGDFSVQLALLRALDESGTRLVRLGFINHFGVDFGRLAKSPHVRHLEHLYLPCVPESHHGSDALGAPTVTSFDGHCMNDKDLRKLAASTTLSSLRRLDLRRSRVRAAGLEALAASKTLHQITHLNLEQSPALFQPIVEILARLPQLREVNLSGILGLDLSTKTGVTLPALERLIIRNSHLSDAKFAHFLRHVRTPRLTHLQVAQNRSLGPLTAAALAADSDFAGLQVLDLHGAGLGDESASTLASSEILSNLRELRLGETGAGERTALAVVANSKLELRALNLSAQGHRNLGTLTASTAQHLAQSPHLAKLRNLDLSFQPLGEDGLIALASSPYLRSLEHLALNWTKATDRSAVALAEAPQLAGLRYLTLGGRDLGSSARLAFARARHMTRLYHLVLFGGEVSKEAGQALREAPHLRHTRL